MEPWIRSATGGLRLAVRDSDARHRYLPEADVAGGPEELRSLQTRYRSQRAALPVSRARKYLVLTKRYAEALEKLLRKRTRDGDNGRARVPIATFRKGIVPYPRRDVWYHIVGTYDGRTIKVYVNGEPDGEEACARIGKKIVDDPVADRVIGGCATHTTWTDTHLAGKVDEIRLWDRALTDREVAELYALERPR
jgi:hypothetical protein